MNDERTPAHRPSAFAENAWRGVSSLAATAALASFVLIANLWRNDSLQDVRVAELEARIAALAESHRLHVESDQRRVERGADESRDAAVAQARLQAAVDAVKGQIDALLQTLARRRL